MFFILFIVPRKFSILLDNFAVDENYEHFVGMDLEVGVLSYLQFLCSHSPGYSEGKSKNSGPSVTVMIYRLYLRTKVWYTKLFGSSGHLEYNTGKI
jgi:hypothetical protein